MEQTLSILETFFSILAWIWRKGGWWALGGGIATFLVVGLGMRPAHSR